MNTVIGIIVGLLVLIFLITAHEFGHFIMARRNGVRVLEFGICFPPRAVAWVKDPETKKWHRLPKSEWDKPQKGLIFSINWLPIGGFCQMDGESAEDSRKGTFGNASFWKKTKILFGGVAVNWLVAIVIFTILAWAGMPKFIEGQFTIPNDTYQAKTPVEVVSVMENSPAAASGIEAGDKIVKVGDIDVVSTATITDFGKAHAGQEVDYTILHNNEEKTVRVKLNTEDAEYMLGITMSSVAALSYSTWSAPIVGVGLTAQLTGETFRGLGTLVWNLISGVVGQFSPDTTVRESGREAISAAGDSVSGPVGIVGVIFPAFTAAGPANLAFLAALISVSLACMNILPIPALDGGRWLLMAIYKLRKKKLDKETEQRIVAKAFVVLLALIVVVTILDITKFFR